MVKTKDLKQKKNTMFKLVEANTIPIYPNNNQIDQISYI